LKIQIRRIGFRRPAGPGDVELPFFVSGGHPISGDFNGDGVDDLAVVKDGVWKVAMPPAPLLDDLSFVADPGADLTTFKFGVASISAPIYGASDLVSRLSSEERETVADDYIIVQWTDLGVYGCAPNHETVPCGVVIELDWWSAAAMTAFVYDIDVDGKEDLVACPSSEGGRVENEVVECS
jgi:hypothetical protein